MVSSDFKGIIIIGGPTASGKTALAIQLAEYFNTEIISADSRQIFKELNIGTAKPDETELKKVKHHLISMVGVDVDYTVANYLHDAQELIAKLSHQHRVTVVCGGTGLYLNALKNGLHNLPEKDIDLRNELNQLFQEEGKQALQQKLIQLDPNAVNLLDVENPRRVIRAIELMIQTGLKLAEIYAPNLHKPDYPIVSFCIDHPRNLLYNRINERVIAMIAQGLEQEAKKLIAYKNHQALQTVGYREWWDYFDGKTDKESTVGLIQQNTRNYAKRQITWFKKDKEINWLSPGDFEAAIEKTKHTLGL